MSEYKIISNNMHAKIVPQYIYGARAAEGALCRHCTHFTRKLGTKNYYECLKRFDKMGNYAIVKGKFAACDEYFEKKERNNIIN